MYHYKMCGLDNVWLENGYIEKNGRYGKTMAICDADQLHKLLACEVSNKKGRLSGQELKFLRNFLCLSQKSLGDMLGCSEGAVSLWERNDAIPVSEDALVRMLILEQVNGNTKVSEMIERINTVDRIVNQKIVAREKQHKWTAEIKGDSTTQEAVCA